MTGRVAALRHVPVLALAMLLMAMLWPADSVAQGGAGLAIAAVDTTHYPRVDVYIAARGDRAVLDTKQPIEIHERLGGARYVLTPTLELVQPGVSVIVLVDQHRRMRGTGMPIPDSQPPATLNRLDTARAAIMRLAQALAEDPSARNQLGIMAYHRDLIEVMPLQPLQPGLVASYIQPKGSRQRLFDIERKPGRTAANDPADPHAKSALSLAVRAAADLLAAQAPAHQQRAIVIIGTTCTDLEDRLTTRADVTCDSIDQTLSYVQQRARAELLAIYGVGVGSHDTKLPLVTPKDSEAGFNYTANFNQIELLTGDPKRFFILHTPDPSRQEDVWKGFADRIIAPIQAQAAQLKVSFEAIPPPAGTSVPTTTIQIGLGGQLLEAQFVAPQLELLVNGTPVAANTLNLGSGQVDLSARYTSPLSVVQARSVQVLVPTPALAATATASEAAPTPTASSSTIQISSYASLFAFLLALVALLYWFVLGRPVSTSSQQQFATPVEDTTKALTNAEQQALQASVQPAQHYLQQILGPRPGEIYPICKNDSSISIGSSSNSVHLYLGDAYISPRHATINQDQGVLTITDHGSKNGTFVNGVKLEPGTPMPLNHNAKIVLGWITILYLNINNRPHPAEPRTPRGQTSRLSTASAGTGSNALPATQNTAGGP